MLLWTALQTWVSKNAAQKAAKLERDKVKNIVVIKHAALGDMLLIRPMLISLRESFPNAKLTLSVVTNYMSGVPEDLVDRIHVSKGNEKRYSFFETYKSYKELGEQDILFDISATSRSFWLTKLTPATLKIGFIHRGLHRLLYDMEGEVPEEAYAVPLGVANRVREGGDVTVVATGLMVGEAVRAADELRGEVGVEVLDPRTIVPLDEEAILSSIRRTGRLVVVDEDYERCGFSAEVAAIAAEKGFSHLEAPVARVATPNVPIPYSPALERHVLPNREKIVRAIRNVMR